MIHEEMNARAFTMNITIAIGTAIRPDSGFSIGGPALPAQSCVGEIPLSVTGDKYYKLGSPRTGLRNFALPFFPLSTLPPRRSHSLRGGLPNEYILVRLPVSCSLSPFPFFFKPSAINLAKGQVWVDSSGDFNGGWRFAPIIGRRYRNGTPAFSLFIYFFFAIRFHSVFLHAGLVPCTLPRTLLPIVLLNLRTSSGFAPSNFIYF